MGKTAITNNLLESENAYWPGGLETTNLTLRTGAGKLGMGPDGDAAGAGGIIVPSGAMASIGCTLIKRGSMCGDKTLASEGEETICVECEEGPAVGVVAFERLAAAADADAMFAGVESTNFRFLL